MMYARYGKDEYTETVINGRKWYKRTYLAPWTHFTPSGPVTVQGMHTTVYTVQNGQFYAVRHYSRQINMWGA